MFKKYYFVFQINNFAEKTILDNNVSKYIKTFLKFRLKKVKYLETFETDNKTYMVIGSHQINKTLKTKIFLFELYAYLKDPQYIPDCKHIIKTINNIRLDIFKI